MDETQRVFLQQEGRAGKFVQLIVKTGDREVPVFASKEKPCFHAEVLSQVLDNLSIAYQFVIDEKNGGIKIPEGKGENYSIVGAGELELSEDLTKLIITRRSFSSYYGAWFNKLHLEQVRSYFPKDLEILLS